MRKLVMIAVLLFTLIVSTSSSIQAHPGRTDSSGCHTCRTNCEKWGLDYGEYHCHNGGSTSSGSSSSNSNNSQVRSESEGEVKAEIKPKVDYSKVGSSDGYNFKISNPEKSLEEASYSYTDTAYKQAFKEGFDKAKNELTTNSEKLAVKNGENDAIKKETYDFEKLPSNIIESVYKNQYKETFDGVENEINLQLKEQAKNDAFQSTYNEVKSSEIKDYGLKKYKDTYKNTYSEFIKKFENQKKEMLNIAKENGKRDGEEGNEQNLDFLDTYKDTKFYTSAKEVYVNTYEENKIEGSVLGGIAIIIAFIILCYILVKKLKNRRRVQSH